MRAAHLRSAIIGLAVGLWLLAALPLVPAFASHITFLVSNPDQNPGGGDTPWLWGINSEWEINGRGNLACSDWGSNYTDMPVEIRQALSDWESVLTGTQFDQGCPGGKSATWFLRRSTTAGYPCDAGAWACTHVTWPWYWDGT